MAAWGEIKLTPRDSEEFNSTMMEELNAASNHLRAALQRYVHACSAVQICLIRENIINHRASQQLSDCIGNELLHIHSYETSIKQAKAAISLSRNCLSAVVPVNALPSEILGYIFQLVLDAQPCNLDPSLRKPLPTDLDQLTHVCTRWRQVAISTHTLWSHIDIAPGYSFSKGLISRAEVYAARAAHSFLDIHIVNCSRKSVPVSEQPSYTTSAQFLTSVAAQTRSLNLKTEATSRGPASEAFYCSILRAYFDACIPGAFTELIIHDQGSLQFVDGFIVATGDAIQSRNLSLDLPQARLEDVWLPVKVLRLTGLYPHWTSKAYHGLVELHLISHTMNITESQLVAIMTASPQLHTLHVGIEISELLPRHDPAALVQLKDLEVLVWTPEWGHSDRLNKFLRWLVPGSKSLQVSIQNFWDDEEGETEPVSFEDETKKFFARSNVTKLHLRGWRIHAPLVNEILGLMPSLRVLALDQGGRVWSDTPVSSPSGSSAHSTHLDSLYLVNSSTNLDELRLVVERCSVQTIALWRCRVYNNQDSRKPLNDAAAEERLRAIYPTAAFNKSHPIQDWDYLVEW